MLHVVTRYLLLPFSELSPALAEMFTQLASCLIYARTLLQYVIFILWVRSVIEMLPPVKFEEDKVLTFLILREKC